MPAVMLVALVISKVDDEPDEFPGIQDV